jgi:hypothetical protein
MPLLRGHELDMTVTLDDNGVRRLFFTVCVDVNLPPKFVILPAGYCFFYLMVLIAPQSDPTKLVGSN